jgi:hypothetical protein
MAHATHAAHDTHACLYAMGARLSRHSCVLRSLRCGPHISFVEPFVMPQHYGEAVKLLTPVLRNIEPFEVVLSEYPPPPPSFALPLLTTRSLVCVLCGVYVLCGVCRRVSSCVG